MRDCLGSGFLGMTSGMGYVLVIGFSGFLCDFWYFRHFEECMDYNLFYLSAFFEACRVAVEELSSAYDLDEIVVRTWNAYFVCATSCLDGS